MQPEYEKLLDLERQTLQTEREALTLRRAALQDEFDALNAAQEEEWAQRDSELDRKDKEFNGKIKRWEEQVSRGKEYGRKRIRLNVGGTVFETTYATLMVKQEANFLAALASQHWAEAKQEEIFIDRDPTFFPQILNYLRGVPLPGRNQMLNAELDFYALKYAPTEETKTKTATTTVPKIVNLFSKLAGSNTGQMNALHPEVIRVSISHPPLYNDRDIANILDCGSLSTYSGNASVTGPQWVAFEFRTTKVRPVYYHFECGRRTGPDFVMRNWALEGSNDNLNWTTLRRHEEDTQNMSSDVHHAGWSVETPANTFYSRLRIRTTGRTTSTDQSAWPFNVYHLNIYGELHDQGQKRAISDDEENGNEDE